MKFYKNGSALSCPQVAILGIATELILLLIQFVALTNYVNHNPENGFVFTTAYINSNGFYIFQIVGFFTYAIMTYVFLQGFSLMTLNKILMFVAVGGVIELLFYLIIRAEYEMAFLYSILDKLVAAAFGMIVYGYTTRQIRKTSKF